MAQNASTSVAVTCPKCHSGGLAPKSALGKNVRCRYCGSTFIASCDPATADLTADELTAGVELPPSSGIDAVYGTGEEEYGFADELARPSAVSQPIASASPESLTKDSPPTRSPAEEPPSDYRIVPPKGASLGWAFFNNTFIFPWMPAAVRQWVVASIGLIIAGELGLFTAQNLFSGSAPHVIMAGSLAMATMWAALLSLSYIAAGFFDVTVNAAYNNDKVEDWPEADWRERVWYLLRVAYLIALAALPAMGIASVASVDRNAIWLVGTAAELILLPIVLLAVLEADSFFWPVSGPIFFSLFQVWYGWIVFYLLSGSLLAGCAVLTAFAFERLEILTPLVAGPVWAAAIFIFARLIGRLAWLILRKAETRD